MPKKSTNGRTVPAAFRALGAAIRALGAVAPRAADRALIGLFCTPVHRAPSPRALPPEATLELLPFENRELAVWSVGDGPVVLLAHGWSGSADDLVPMAGLFRRAGFRAVFFDMPAHGRSTGRRSDLPQLARAVRAVALHAAGGAPLHAVVGHSLGGAAVALALRDGLPADHAILIAPPARAEVYMNRMTEALGLPPAQRARALAALAVRAGGSLARVSAVEAVQSLRIPALIVHDRRDREVAWDEGAEIAAAWPGATLHSTDGLGHRRLLSDGGVLDAIFEFAGASQRVPAHEYSPHATAPARHNPRDLPARRAPVRELVAAMVSRKHA